MQLNRKVQYAFSRVADQYDAHAVLQHEVSDRVLQRLDFVKLDPRWILDVGAGTGFATQGLSHRYAKARVCALDISPSMLMRLQQKLSWRMRRKVFPLVGAAEALPFADNSFDLVFSSLTLQWCSNLEQVFRELLRVLKPQGLLMFATLGPDTLYELRQAWAQVDDRLHVNQFVDMHDIGDLMVNTGFAGPVLDAERIVLTYDELKGLMLDLKRIGANTVIQRSGYPGLLGKSRYLHLTRAYEDYRSDGVLPATYEIVYGHAWKAASSPKGAKESPIIWKT